MSNEFTLDDLVNLSGLPLRTIRFYVQEGLLEGPDTRGRFSLYSQRHLDRLQVIKRLKKLRLPLQEIRNLLASMTPEEVNRLYPEQDVQSPYARQGAEVESKPLPASGAGASALEYIRNLELARRNILLVGDASESNTSQEKRPASSGLANENEQILAGRVQQNWRKIIICEGVELHLLEGISAEDDPKIKQLLMYIDQLFDDKAQKG